MSYVLNSGQVQNRHFRASSWIQGHTHDPSSGYTTHPRLRFRYLPLHYTGTIEGCPEFKSCKYPRSSPSICFIQETGQCHSSLNSKLRPCCLHLPNHFNYFSSHTNSSKWLVNRFYCDIIYSQYFIQYSGKTR